MVTRTAAIGNGTSAPSTTENFIYNGQNIALVLDADGNVIERELTGTAADQVFATESVISGLTNWYLTDNQGTVRDVVQYSDSSTTSVDHLVYGAFGQLVSQSVPSDAPTFYYNGTWQDAQTGFYLAGQQWYDAVDAVYLTMADPGATNPYEYSGNDPTNNVPVMSDNDISQDSAVGILTAGDGSSGSSGGGGSSGGTPVFADNTEGFSAIDNGFAGGFVALANGQSPPLPAFTPGKGYYLPGYGYFWPGYYQTGPNQGDWYYQRPDGSRYYPGGPQPGWHGGFDPNGNWQWTPRSNAPNFTPPTPSFDPLPQHIPPYNQPPQNPPPQNPPPRNPPPRNPPTPLPGGPSGNGKWGNNGKQQFFADDAGGWNYLPNDKNYPGWWWYDESSPNPWTPFGVPPGWSKPTKPAAPQQGAPQSPSPLQPVSPVRPGPYQEKGTPPKNPHFGGNFEFSVPDASIQEPLTPKPKPKH